MGSWWRHSVLKPAASANFDSLQSLALLADLLLLAFQLLDLNREQLALLRETLL